MNTKGILKYICTSVEKGVTKDHVQNAKLVENQGIKDDAHVGDWHRQVSILDENDIDSMRAAGLDLKPGAFGENLVLENINIDNLGIGSKLKIGNAILDITQVGKVCHSHCQIYYETGDCIMPRLGLFARVIKGDNIHPGMEVSVDKFVDRKIYQVGVLTISDSVTAGKAKDTAGPAIVKIIEDELDAHIAWTGTVADEEAQIIRLLIDLTNRKYDMIVTTGGTGFGPRDITPEATKKVIQREVPGLSEAMRMISARNSTQNAWLQRGICGIRRSTLIINLPGSMKGAQENLRVVLSVLPHAIRHLRGDIVHKENIER
ncbi:MAG: molybdopterin-binding protein [Candidatus Electryonea clarkiae]|nr:molybdopterin-binding protein [Candidatus Electryonea clarkiae]MDP8287788.1 molybdopterin-binding protein [Candidatus Electryonea clarkiae]